MIFRRVYSTCLFCHSALGRNEALEHFPVGRRLAYDASKGRLWVVCRRCERWNLTPQEERWEAIEEAERAYRGTRLRAATDNVGLARLRDGTELVRIGAPLRPEFAAWRYGDQFGRRRRKHLVVTGGIVAAVATGVVVGPVLGIMSLAAANPVLQATNWTSLLLQRRRARMPFALEGRDGPFRVRVDEASAAQLIAFGVEGFAIEVGGGPHVRPRTTRHRLEGADAVRAAGRLLPLINRVGGTKHHVQAAVRLFDEATSVDDVFRRVARLPEWGSHWRASGPPSARSLAGLDVGARLALEMAAHEEQERRAMEGELAELERAWRDADEIAGIADDLLLPASIGERLDQLRGRSTARAGAASSPSSDSGSASSS